VHAKGKSERRPNQTAVKKGIKRAYKVGSQEGGGGRGGVLHKAGRRKNRLKKRGGEKGMQHKEIQKTGIGEELHQD